MLCPRCGSNAIIRRRVGPGTDLIACCICGVREVVTRYRPRRPFVPARRVRREGRQLALIR
jgi:hypothetical protein